MDVLRAARVCIVTACQQKREEKTKLINKIKISPQSHPNRRKKRTATAVDRDAKLESNCGSNDRSMVTLDDQRFLYKICLHKKKDISRGPTCQKLAFFFFIHKKNAYCMCDRLGVASFRAEQRYMKNY